MYLFTSESVCPGHPDKCADAISDSIVDYLLARDHNARVATDVYIAGKHVVIGGEVKTKVKIDKKQYEKIARQALIKAGYNGKGAFTRQETLHPDDVVVHTYINKQNPDITRGVEQDGGELGAGDQGMMFGYADCETENFMPSAVTYARQIMTTIYQYALKHPDQLGTNIKTQVTMDYGNKENFLKGHPIKIHTLVVNAPCVSSMSIDELRSLVRKLIIKTKFPTSRFNIDDCILHINPTGRYVNHGPLHDSGLTGRKLIVDSFGGYSPIGGGAQSGKDYSKVDRSGLYAARWLAKHIVAAKLALKATVQISYAIGVAKPVSVTVNTYGTAKNKIKDEELAEFITEHYPLTPRWITTKFTLDRPSKETFLYADTAANGQVGGDSYPWEQLTDLSIFKAFGRR